MKTNNFFVGIYISLTNHPFFEFLSFYKWWLVLVLKIMLYNYIGAGYEVRNITDIS